MTTLTMTAPKAYLTISLSNGNSYTSDANCLITGIATYDVTDLLNNGCKYAGNTTEYINLTGWRTSSGQLNPAAASSGIFGLSNVVGSSLLLLGEATSSNSKTDTTSNVFSVPSALTAGSNFNLIVNCQFTSSGTNTSSTIALAAYKITSAGLSTSSENLVLTSAQTITSSAADYTFVLNGAPSSGNLTGGTPLGLLMTGICATSSGSNTFQINSVRYNLP